MSPVARSSPWFAALLAGLAACSDLPPSVILVSWDTVRRDHLSLYGYERETTPFLEELARESAVYDNAYTTASFTLTAHMSMLTGLYPAQHGVEEQTALSPEVPLLAERLRARSYHTVAIYRGGWIDERFGYDRGFDVFESREGAEAAGAALREALAARPPDRPLFLFLHLFDAHCGTLEDPESTVYDPPAEYADLFRPGARERLQPHPAHDLYYGPLRPDAGQSEDLIALYDSAIRYLDDELRDWVGEWRQAGFFDDALFVLTADHGEALGQRGMWRGHGGFWEEGLQVPLVVRYPDGHAAAAGLRGTHDARLASAVDILPTVLDVLGLERETWLPGRSLLGAPRAGEAIVAQRHQRHIVMDGRFKALARDVVFDLALDPEELAPLEGRACATERARLQALAQRIAELDVPGEAIPARAPTAEMRAHLDALGYAGDALEEDASEMGTDAKTLRAIDQAARSSALSLSLLSVYSAYSAYSVLTPLLLGLLLGAATEAEQQQKKNRRS